jgi:isopenicillin N synthase-like dioxygenase
VLPEDEFRGPVWEYYKATDQLGQTIWKILLQGLGYQSPEDIMARFTKKPVVTLKLIRTPPAQTPKRNKAQLTQFGTWPHTDFGGVTCLLQQPGKDGLEIWSEEKGGWVLIPAVEDVFVINVGDLMKEWSGGLYKSVKHRVINIPDVRYSCATFWLGDVHITNPLSLGSYLNAKTVGEQIYERFRKQYGLWDVMDPADYSLAAEDANATCIVQ